MFSNQVDRCDRRNEFLIDWSRFDLDVFVAIELNESANAYGYDQTEHLKQDHGNRETHYVRKMIVKIGDNCVVASVLIVDRYGGVDVFKTRFLGR